MPVASREGVQDWLAAARADDQRSLFAWLSLSPPKNATLRTAALLAAFDVAPNLVRCALDCQAFDGTHSDAPNNDLLERFATEFAAAGSLELIPAAFQDLGVNAEGSAFVWFDEDAGSGRPPPSSRSRSRGRGGRGGGGARGRGGRGASGTADSRAAPSQAEFDTLLARIDSLEAAGSMEDSGGDGTPSGSRTFTEAEVARLVRAGVDSALAEINTGARAINISAATAKQRRRCTEWDLRPSMRVHDVELPAPGDGVKNVLEVSQDTDPLTRTESDRAAIRHLLFASILPAERTKKLLQRYPAAASWTLPPEIPCEHELAYDQLGVRSSDGDLCSKQVTMLDDLRPLVFCLQKLGDLSSEVDDFAALGADETPWDADDAGTLAKIASAAREATQAASDVFHILGSKVSEVQRERDRLAVIAESGVRGAQLQFDPDKFSAVPVAPDSPQRWSTIRPDITERAAAVRTRTKQLGLAFDAVATKKGGKPGAPGGRKPDNSNKPPLTKEQREKRARRNKKRAEKRRAASAGKTGGAPPEPQKAKGKGD